MLPSLATIVWLVIYVLCAIAVFCGLDWLVRTAPFVPPDWKPNLRWGLAALGLLVLIGILLAVFGGVPVFRA